MEKLERQINEIYKICRIDEKKEIVTTFRTTLYDAKLQSQFTVAHPQQNKEPKIVFSNSTTATTF